MGLKAIRSLGEHICIDLILHHKSSEEVTDDLRSAIGGLLDGEFLEP
ncbi:unnamed protein product, partial [Rotaria sp. Silwood1]